MNPNQPTGPIDIKKLIATIDERFVSGNSVAVERVHVRDWEWAELKHFIAELKNRKDCGN